MGTARLYGLASEPSCQPPLYPVSTGLHALCSPNMPNMHLFDAVPHVKCHPPPFYHLAKSYLSIGPASSMQQNSWLPPPSSGYSLKSFNIELMTPSCLIRLLPD